MTALGIDLGGTKLSFAVLSGHGEILQKHKLAIEKRKGNEVGDLLIKEAKRIISTTDIGSIGIAVPGIYHADAGKVWAPNIDGWEDYPLLDQVRGAVDVPVHIDSDRACCILGETWKGNAKGCRHAIYLAVGTGIGAGILIDGKILRGAEDIAGAIGWLALRQPYDEKYNSCGCFEYHASGEGIAKVAKEILKKNNDYKGVLRMKTADNITAPDVFDAYEKKDVIAEEVFKTCIKFWGMAVANLVSLFNPEKIILGGGVFGPAVKFIDEIKAETTKWAQPVSIKKMSLEISALGNDAGLYGAGYLGLYGRNVVTK